MNSAFVPLLKKAGRGRRILNIASIMGVRGLPDFHPLLDCQGRNRQFHPELLLAISHRMALWLTRSRPDLSIRRCPSSLMVRMSMTRIGSAISTSNTAGIPLRRFASPADMAGPAFFLCSDDFEYVTGQILMVDGGASATFLRFVAVTL